MFIKLVDIREGIKQLLYSGHICKGEKGVDLWSANVQQNKRVVTKKNKQIFSSIVQKSRRGSRVFGRVREILMIFYVSWIIESIVSHT